MVRFLDPEIIEMVNKSSVTVGCKGPGGKFVGVPTRGLGAADDFGMRVRRSSQSAFGWSTVNDVSGQYKCHYCQAQLQLQLQLPFS